MPVGPSHGSRGRSSFGGSSSRSRSSSRSYGGSSRSYSRSSSRSYSRPRSGSHHTTIFVGGGGGGYYSGGVDATPMSPKARKITWLIIGIIVCLLFGFVGFSKFSRNIGAVSLMKKDAKEYAQIIKYAEQGKDGYYIINIADIKNSGSDQYGNQMEFSFYSDNYDFRANAYNFVYKDGVEYFYLEYSFTDDHNNTVNGETYTYYSEAAIQSLNELTIAYTKNYDNDGSWDSMDANYKLSNNMDYWFAKKECLIGAPVMLIFFGLAGLFIYMIVRIKQNKPIFKKAAATSSTTEVRKHRTCKYCGTTVSKDTFKCPSCGGNKFHEPTVQEDSDNTANE